jgi:hypothetical protein
VRHKHKAPSVEQRAYYQARQRCSNSNSPDWKYYGARGIEFRFNSFAEFIADIGPKPSPELELDRRDNSGHYEPGNIRWSTRRVQIQNRRPFSAETRTKMAASATCRCQTEEGKRRVAAALIAGRANVTNDPVNGRFVGKEVIHL